MISQARSRPAADVAYTSPGTWRPYRRCYDLARQSVHGSYRLAKPVTVLGAFIFLVFAGAAVTALLGLVWVFRLTQFIWFGRRSFE